MNSKFSKLKKGFSMVELLVVTSIVLIATSTLFVNNNSKKGRTEVEVAARQLAAQLRVLQNEATSGKQIGSDYVSTITLNTSNSTPNYSVVYKKNGGGEIAGATLSLNLAKHKVKFNSANDSIVFSSPLGRVDSNRTIVLKSDRSGGDLYNVCVSARGTIIDQKNDCVF